MATHPSESAAVVGAVGGASVLLLLGPSSSSPRLTFDQIERELSLTLGPLPVGHIRQIQETDRVFYDSLHGESLAFASNLENRDTNYISKGKVSTTTKLCLGLSPKLLVTNFNEIILHRFYF